MLLTKNWNGSKQRAIKGGDFSSGQVSCKYVIVVVVVVVVNVIVVVVVDFNVVDVVVDFVVVDVVVDVARDFVVKLRHGTKPVFYSISLNRNLKAIKPIKNDHKTSSDMLLESKTKIAMNSEWDRLHSTEVAYLLLAQLAQVHFSAFP